MNKFLKLTWAMMLLAGFVGLQSCNKDFDSPPAPGDPAIVANTSIAALKAMHTTGGAYDVITSNVIISGVVVANDKSGNLYKTLYIQDSTGGLQVSLDAPSLYGSYPVGRRIFIRCKDLCLSDYNYMIQLGVKATVAGIPSIEAIPSALISKYVVGGSLNNPVVAKKVNVDMLTTSMQDKYLGTLIELDNFAFANPTGSYGDTSAYKSTVNRDVKNCPADGNKSIIVRTSAYANFAAWPVAKGRGKLRAIYTIFGSTKQLLLRDTADVLFTNPYTCALPAGTLLSEDFESIGANNSTLALTGWKNIGETGGILYQNALFGPVKCAKVTAFSSGVTNVTSWLISPQISLAGAAAPKLSFTNAAGFLSGVAVLKVYVSTNYAGGNNPSASTWTELPATYVTPPASGFSAFVSSGDLSLSPYIGQNVYIGFKYTGGDPSGTTTWEIDDVKVVAQ